MIVLDWFRRKVVGWQLSCRCRTKEWCEALEEAVLREFPHGVRGQGLKLVSDNGCHPTSRSFLKVTATLDIEQIFTSFNNPKGNAETERFMRTLKEELLWKSLPAWKKPERSSRPGLTSITKITRSRLWAIRARRNMSAFTKKPIWTKPPDTTQNRP